MVRTRPWTTEGTGPPSATSLNPYVFIVGAPRSGTTLLKRIVDAHPEIAVTRETHWITRLIGGDPPSAATIRATPQLRSKLASDARFARLRGDLTQMGLGDELERLVAGDGELGWGELVSSIFDLYGRGAGKPLVGDKTPRYVRHIPTLHALWPAARFVHLIRDGRDVCSSVLAWRAERRMLTRFSTWQSDPVSTIAVWWEQLVRLGREAGGELPGLYHEVRYERLVSDPAGECRALCEFLDVPFDEGMIRFHEGRTRSEPGLDAKHAWRPIAAGLRSWRSELPSDSVERFEAVAGELLAELGYERGAPEPSGPALDRAVRLRHAYVSEAGRQRLPRGWAA
jgi:Sulfotransferase family